MGTKDHIVIAGDYEGLGRGAQAGREADAPSIPVPRPANGATLVARSYLDAARILRAQRKPDEALRYFEQATSYGPPLVRRAPKIGTGRPRNLRSEI